MTEDLGSRVRAVARGLNADNANDFPDRAALTLVVAGDAIRAGEDLALMVRQAVDDGLFVPDSVLAALDAYEATWREAIHTRLDEIEAARHP
jgi:hypothetical protein